jgi:hypothetical protein
MIILPCSVISQGPSQSNESFIKDQGCVNRTPDHDKTRVRIKDIKWQQGKPKKLREDMLRCHIMHREFHMRYSALHPRLLVKIIIINNTKFRQDNNKFKTNYYLLDFLYSLLWTEVDVKRDCKCKKRLHPLTRQHVWHKPLIFRRIMHSGLCSVLPHFTCFTLFFTANRAGRCLERASVIRIIGSVGTPNGGDAASKV